MKKEIASKWQRETRELFEFYQATHLEIRGEPSNEVLGPFFALNVQEARKWVDQGDIRELITFAVTHWDRLREHDTDGRNLETKPSFYQTLAPWRFPKWLKLSRDGVFVSAKKAEFVFKPI